MRFSNDKQTGEMTITVNESDQWTLINGLAAAADYMREEMAKVRAEQPNNKANEPFIKAILESAQRYADAAALIKMAEIGIPANTR